MFHMQFQNSLNETGLRMLGEDEKGRFSHVTKNSSSENSQQIK